MGKLILAIVTQTLISIEDYTDKAPHTGKWIPGLATVLRVQVKGKWLTLVRSQGRYGQGVRTLRDSGLVLEG